MDRVVVFLLVVAATLGIYFSGFGSLIAEWFNSYEPLPEAQSPATTAPTAETGASGSAEGDPYAAAPATNYDTSSPYSTPASPYPTTPTSRYPGASSPYSTPPTPDSTTLSPYPGAPSPYPTTPSPYPEGSYSAPGATSAAPVNGALLRVTLVPSQQGLDAACTTYAIVNRSQRPIQLVMATANGAGILVPPGQAAAHETLPQQCSELRGSRYDPSSPTQGQP